LRIVDYDDLPEGLEPGVQLLDATTGWYPMDFARMKEARRLGYPTSSYFAVYAVEGNEVQSVVRVLRIPYTMADGGVESISGLQGLVTRPERSRMGLARRLLEEVHAREAAAGNRFVILWTGRGLMAHNLYESTGYVDVYTPSIAVLRCVKPRKVPDGYEMRRGKRDDARSIHELHAEATAGRVGFTPRPKGILPALFKLGFTKPDAFRLMLHKGELVGYAQLERGVGWAKSMEVVLKEGFDVGVALSLLESEASEGWLTLSGTFVSDQRSLLARRGYALTGNSYSSLLARPLEGKRESLLGDLGTVEPSFTCQYLDGF
jgi:GNAT superfamily N-acetyltransferase